MKLLRRIGLALGVTATATVLAVAAGTADAGSRVGRQTDCRHHRYARQTHHIADECDIPPLQRRRHPLKVANRSGKIIERFR